MSANSGPGYRKHPDHRITTTPARGRLRVTFDGEVIADTTAAIRLDESSYPAVYYVPRSDVVMKRLTPTTHRTYCPFKGHAAYYSFKDGPENAVWTYEKPYDEMSVLRELLAFYPDKVDSIKTT